MKRTLQLLVAALISLSGPAAQAVVLRVPVVKPGVHGAGGASGVAPIGTVNASLGAKTAAMNISLSPGLPHVGVLPATVTPEAGISPVSLPASAKIQSAAQVPSSIKRGTMRSAVAPTESAGALRSRKGKGQTLRGRLAVGVASVKDAKGHNSVAGALNAFWLGIEIPDGNFAPNADLGDRDLAWLEGHAKWWEVSLADRLQSVQLVSAQNTPEAKDALVRIAESNPEGDAADYEVHRQALRELANNYGELRSLRRISESHAAQILADLKENKPAMVITDYDDTLKPFKEPLTAGDGVRFQAVAEAGVQAVILTDRPAVKKRESDVGVLDSVSALSPEQKAGLTVISDKSLKSTTFDEEGAAQTTEGEKVAWTELEYAALEQAKDVVLAEVETIEYGDPAVRFSLYDSGLAIFLKLQMPADEVEAAAVLLKEELAKRGVTGYNVVGRTPARDPHKNPPYLSVTKVDKSIGVKRILAQRGIDSRDVLILGDQFMTQGAGRPTDEYMVDGAPGSTAIAVGPTADPRLDGVVLWNTEGEEASGAILEALGATK